MPENHDAKVRVQLGGVPETLLLALWSRARENEKDRPFLPDPKAAEIVGRMDYDFGRIARSLSEIVVATSNVSSRHCDEAIRAFMAGHPEATIVNLGAGLDTAFYRVDNGRVRWYDLDLPEVIALRRRLIPETDRSRCIAKSLLDTSWFDDIGPAGQGVFLSAHAVLAYFDATDLKRLFSALATRFPGAEMVFNTYNILGRCGGSQLAVRRAGIRNAPLKWALGPARRLARWDNHIEIIDEWRLFSRVPREPPWKWSTVVLMKFSDWFRMQSMVRLRFSPGGPES